MKEILYIQAGSLANYVGTHFWNTQENYFIYGSEDDEGEPIVSNDISFKDDLAYKVSPYDVLRPIGPRFDRGDRSYMKGEPILCPRLLAFDRKGKWVDEAATFSPNSLM